MKEKYSSDPPETFKEITSFKGIGPKMAHLYLQCCCDKVEGIAVDVHVHRICNRLKWTNSKSPEETMKQLQEWLPKELYVDINFVIVGFGQTICEAKKPKCDQCLIRDSCPFFRGEVKDSTKSNNGRSRSKSKSKSFSVKNKKTKLAGISDNEIESEEESLPDSDEEFKNVKRSNKIVKENNPRERRTRSKSSKKLKENDDSYFNDLEKFEDEKFLNDSSFLKVKNKNNSNKDYDVLDKKNLRKSQSKNDLVDIKNKTSIGEDDSEDKNKTLRRKSKSNKVMTRVLPDSDNEASRISLLKQRRKKK